ncbi:MAG: hypothetical protein ACI90V_002379, partial [Bacillariaceae sp.]
KAKSASQWMGFFSFSLDNVRVLHFLTRASNPFDTCQYSEKMRHKFE